LNIASDIRKDLSNLELEKLLHRIDNNFEGEAKERLLLQFWKMTHPKEIEEID
jgi:hypothetical protein